MNVPAGYYVAGLFLLSTVVRPAAAYLAHLRSDLDELRRTVEQTVHRIDAALDGVSDQQELLTGIRALVRMIRTDAA